MLLLQFELTVTFSRKIVHVAGDFLVLLARFVAVLLLLLFLTLFLSFFSLLVDDDVVVVVGDGGTIASGGGLFEAFNPEFSLFLCCCCWGSWGGGLNVFVVSRSGIDIDLSVLCAIAAAALISEEEREDKRETKQPEAG
jgi:hypothetical protein